ncbi:FecR family protein [Sphingobacterium deserti]|uniref:FecR protein n=1 Tax=Sphingobacterium deserti TaxID=1229276 RepID=A0A0B8TAH4_9SPHI|nr:FecR family protein [Sphingobacterium deserti]KGE15864.1 FecR protein [Sphingobacterium deserti]
MSLDRKKIRSLLQAVFLRYLRRESNPDERNLIDQFYENVPQKLICDQDLRRIGSEMEQEIASQTQRQPQKAKRKYKLYISAAACIALLFTFLTIYVLRYKGGDTLPKQRSGTIVGATLRIGNDRFNIQDSLPKGGSLETSGGETVLNLTNIQPQDLKDTITVSNPSNEIFTVVLQDGSVVKLAPMALVQYVSEVDAHERRVLAKGIASFAVKKLLRNGQRIPFIVETRLQTIEVLGTRFKIDASADTEENIHLEEGSVRLMHNASKNKVLLVPGEKAFVAEGESKIYVLHGREKEKLEAWRNGLFAFEGEKLENVMHELADWYDTDIRVIGSAKDLPITGTVSRYQHIEEVLGIIEMTNKVRYFKKKGVTYVTKR